MLPQCPKCGSTRSRLSRAQSQGERFRALLGHYPLRCRDCHERYIGHFSRLQHWRDACCPKCYRTTLSSWDEEYYRPKFWQRVRITLGAKQVRCDVCRYNFTSFLRVAGQGWAKPKTRPSPEPPRGRSTQMPRESRLVQD